MWNFAKKRDKSARLIKILFWKSLVAKDFRAIRKTLAKTKSTDRKNNVATNITVKVKSIRQTITVAKKKIMAKSNAKSLSIMCHSISEKFFSNLFLFAMKSMSNKMFGKQNNYNIWLTTTCISYYVMAFGSLTRLKWRSQIASL